MCLCSYLLLVTGIPLVSVLGFYQFGLCRLVGIYCMVTGILLLICSRSTQGTWGVPGLVLECWLEGRPYAYKCEDSSDDFWEVLHIRDCHIGICYGGVLTRRRSMVRLPAALPTSWGNVSSSEPWQAAEQWQEVSRPNGLGSWSQLSCVMGWYDWKSRYLSSTK